MTPLSQLLCGRQATKPLGALLRGRGAVYLARRGVNENEERLSTGVRQTLLDMPSTIVSNSHFGKRPTAREMTTFVSHVTTQRVNPY